MDPLPPTNKVIALISKKTRERLARNYLIEMI